MAKVEILLSQAKTVAPDFDKAVAGYIAALEAHRYTEGQPAPTAHFLVERAVSRVQHPVEAEHQPVQLVEREIDGAMVTVTEPVGEPVRFMSSRQPDDFVPNYVIVDDTPPPPTLDERKMALVAIANATANDAINRFSPPLKRRLAELTIARAFQVSEDKRTATDKAVIAQAEDFAARRGAIEFHLAEVEATISDLTDDTIDGWEMPEFPA